VNLSNADPGFANLFLSNPRDTNLHNYLGDAKLLGTDLTNADLSDADRSRAIFFSTVMMGANLRGVKITNKQLALVRKLERAILPDGSKHD